MTITTTQKVIKIGDSAGITLPAKALKKAGIKAGDSIEISFKLVPSEIDLHTAEVVQITQDLLARHKQALQNLSQR